MGVVTGFAAKEQGWEVEMGLFYHKGLDSIASLQNDGVAWVWVLKVHGWEVEMGLFYHKGLDPIASLQNDRLARVWVLKVQGWHRFSGVFLLAFAVCDFVPCGLFSRSRGKKSRNKFKNKHFLLDKNGGMS